MEEKTERTENRGESVSNSGKKRERNVLVQQQLQIHSCKLTAKKTEEASQFLKQRKVL
jgi:hypothetical protein